MSSTTTSPPVSPGQPHVADSSTTHQPQQQLTHSNMLSLPSPAYPGLADKMMQQELHQDHRHDHGRPHSKEKDEEDDGDDEENVDHDEATIALNAADRSFLETLQRHEDERKEANGQDDGGDDDDDALRYHRQTWQQVLDLGDNERAEVDYGTTLGAALERGLLIGPLLPATGPAASGTAEGIIGPCMLGASTEQTTDRSTLQDLEELAALTRDMDTSLDRTGKRTNESVMDSPVVFFPGATAPTDIFVEGRTPPRKRKFHMTQQPHGMENLLLDSFQPPAQRIRQDQHDANPPTRETLQRTEPHSQQQAPPTNFTLDFDSAQHNGEVFAVRELDHRMTPQGIPINIRNLGPSQQILAQQFLNKQQPISLARKRWNFVTTEQSKVQKALQYAKEEFEKARKNLQDAEKQHQSVQEVVAATCRDCYSFLVQEDKPWYECYQMLEAYHAEFGNTLVPRNANTIKKASKTMRPAGSNNQFSDYHFSKLSKLGRWVGNQRNLFKKGVLEEYKIYALKRLGFDFDPVESKWREQYQLLLDFAKENGHAKVPYVCTPKGEKADATKGSDEAKNTSSLASLGAWIKRQQYQYKRYQEGRPSEMTDERIRLLNDAGMIWSRREESFAYRMRELREHKAAHGHIQVKPGLANFVRDQKSKYNEYKKNPRGSTLSRKQVRLLEEIGIANIDKRGSTWKERLEELKEFRRIHGHCVVPSQYPKNQRLASWCKRQRQNFRLGLLGQHNSLTKEQLSQLKDVGFDFKIRDDRRKCADGSSKSWDEHFAEARKFKDEKGHCNIPETDELGRWLQTQKELLERFRDGNAVEISPTQAETLEELLSEPLNQHTWEEWFTALLAHRIHTNSYRIPKSERGLNHFVEEQRNEYAKYINGQPSRLTFEQIMRLKRIKFPFNLKARTGQQDKAAVRKSWDEMFTDLMQFYLVHNSFTVPKTEKELFEWIQLQRKLYQQYMDTESRELPGHVLRRLNKLKIIGFPFHNGAGAPDGVINGLDSFGY